MRSLLQIAILLNLLEFCKIDEKFTFQVNPELEKIQDDVDKYFGEDSYDKYRFDISC